MYRWWRQDGTSSLVMTSQCLASHAFGAGDPRWRTLTPATTTVRRQYEMLSVVYLSTWFVQSRGERRFLKTRDLIADWRRACSNVRGTKPISIVSHCTGLPPIGKTGKIRKGQGIRKWSKKSRVWVCVCVCVRVVCCVLPCVESWTQKLDSGKISDIPIIVGRRN